MRYWKTKQFDQFLSKGVFNFMKWYIQKLEVIFQKQLRSPRIFAQILTSIPLNATEPFIFANKLTDN